MGVFFIFFPPSVFSCLEWQKTRSKMPYKASPFIGEGDHTTRNLRGL